MKSTKILKDRTIIKAAIVLLIGATLVAACAAQTKKKKPKPAQTKTPAATGNKTAAAAGKNKIDACAILPKETVERIFGQTVKSVELTFVTEGTSVGAAFSQCEYLLANNQFPQFFARRSPLVDNTPESIQKVRDAQREVSGADPVEIENLGDTAFWTKKTKQLHVFIGENLYLFVTMMNFKDETEARTKGVEMLRQALTNLK